MMRYLSICSGIEAASAAWEPLGWQPVGFSEIDKFASAVLKYRHPSVPNFGDMLGYRSWDVPRFDILVGGPPCQAFSVSGLRQGLADPRGQLSLTYCDLADHFDPAFTLWENVPGVLSDRTNPFGCLLGRLCGAPAALQPAEGHKWPRSGMVSGPSRTLAWRVLDAQYFGLAQRRERVFLLAARGSRNWTAPAALFPVGESVPRNTPPGRPAGQGFTYDLAPCLTASGRGFERTGDTRGQDCVVPVVADTVPALTASLGRRGGVFSFPETDGLIPEVAACLTARDGKGPDSDTKPGHLIPIVADITPPLDTRSGRSGASQFAISGGLIPVVYDTTQITSPSNYSNPQPGDPCHPLAAGQHPPTLVTIHGAPASEVASLSDVACTLRARTPGYHENSSHSVVLSFEGVRRLTPTECERLQGFPDSHTRVPYPVKPATDSPRYKAIGNSMAVNAMRWIAERILFAQSIMPRCDCGEVKLGVVPRCPICD